MPPGPRFPLGAGVRARPATRPCQGTGPASVADRDRPDPLAERARGDARGDAGVGVRVEVEGRGRGKGKGEGKARRGICAYCMMTRSRYPGSGIIQGNRPITIITSLGQSFPILTGRLGRISDSCNNTSNHEKTSTVCVAKTL